MHYTVITEIKSAYDSYNQSCDPESDEGDGSGSEPDQTTTADTQDEPPSKKSKGEI